MLIDIPVIIVKTGQKKYVKEENPKYKNLIININSQTHKAQQLQTRYIQSKQYLGPPQHSQTIDKIKK